MGNKKIVYIAGYSRSGSTILDIILGSHATVFGTGELAYLFDDWQQPDRLCTCGQTYDNCLFWQHFTLPAGISLGQAVSIIRKVESRSSLHALTHNKIPSAIIEQYKAVQTALFHYIFRMSGADVVIDSSKTSRDMAGRFYALQQHAGFDVYVIHLVKNGLSVVESFVKKGRNWALEGYGKNDRFLAARSSTGWYLANAIARKLGRQMPAGRYLQVRYEDLASQPDVVLQKIGAFINIDLQEQQAMIQNHNPFTAAHNVGGNRLRLEKEIQFSPSHNTRQPKVPVLQRVLFFLIAGRLQKQFGYPR